MSSEMSETNTGQRENIEVVVGIFDSQDHINSVAQKLKAEGSNLQRVTRGQGDSAQMPEILYEDVEEISPDAVAKGALSGGAIGVGSGLLLLGVPVLNVLAPLAAGLAGAWIGAVAGADEANRAIELPTQEDYRRMLAEGKSFLVMAGAENERLEYANVMKEGGAIEVHQHPPTLHAVRESQN